METEFWRRRKGWLYSLPGKEGTQQASVSRTVTPSLEYRERSYSWVSWSGVCDKDQGSNSLAVIFLLRSFKNRPQHWVWSSPRVGLLTRLGYLQGLLILMSFNLASGGFVAALPLISNCSNALWNSGKVMAAGVLLTRNGGPKGLCAL